MRGINCGSAHDPETARHPQIQGSSYLLHEAACFWLAEEPYPGMIEAYNSVIFLTEEIAYA
jgi:hypothetical protein